MKIHKIATIGLICVCYGYTPQAEAQIQHFDGGQSGMSFGGGFFLAEDARAFGGGASYIYQSNMEFGVNFYKTVYDAETIGDDGSATEFDPYFVYNFLKPIDENKIGGKFMIEYSSTKFDSNFLDDLGWDMSGRAIIIGFSAYTLVNTTQGFEICPEVGVFHMSQSVEIEDSYGNSIDEDETDIGFKLGLGFVVSPQVVISPSFTILEDANSWGVSIRMNMPQ